MVCLEVVQQKKAYSKYLFINNTILKSVEVIIMGIDFLIMNHFLNIVKK
jgi:hypothetical protein